MQLLINTDEIFNEIFCFQNRKNNCKTLYKMNFILYYDDIKLTSL